MGSPDVILHTCDLSSDDMQALTHAAILAWRSDAKLVSVHAGKDASLSQKIPDADAIVKRWNGNAVLEHQRIVRDCCDDVIEGILLAVRETKPNLVVAATHSRPAWQRVLRASVAEAVADETHIPTLFIPVGSCGALDEIYGKLNTTRIVVAAEDTSAVDAAAPWVSWLASHAGAQGEVVILHAGGLSGLDDSIFPEIPGWSWRFESVNEMARLEDSIAEYVQRFDTILVMPTHGHDSLADMMFGSTTERVLHQIKRPLLAVPY
jgi:nucleotide-binding universal stress UspA family protein